MKFSYVMMMASTLAFLACGDDSSSSSGAEPDSSASEKSSEDKSSKEDTKLDCSVTDGVKVVSPKEGDSFKVGDTITVVFGSDMDFGGFGIEYRYDDGAEKVGLLDESYDGVVDGKTCNEVKVVLDEDLGVEPADDAYIRVYPYSKQVKGSNSGTIKVKE
ncbi:MAG: hypothetical protein MJY82_02705 [Fibrobacter sp.]|nr:hypothetical protein [Fibrobacter sp.]